MALTKSRRMQILLAIDLVFFFIELITGYAVHSLALVADSFHMFNDVLSLCVGLWAVSVANRQSSSKTYTYGWQLAETLGALVNGVFLVALCVTIVLDAIQRFVEPQKVDKPMFVLIVGCLGLFSNVIGLFLFHDHSHGHGHGEEEHSHDSHAVVAAEEGHQTKTVGTIISDASGNIADVLPQATVGGWPKSDALTRTSEGDSPGKADKPKAFASSDEDDTTVTPNGSTSPVSFRKQSLRRHTRGGSRSIFPSADDISGHPSSFRKDFIQSSRYNETESQDDLESAVDSTGNQEDRDATEETPLIKNEYASSHSRRKSDFWKKSSDELHEGHNHCQPKEKEKEHGHSHSDLNMRGVFLHVMGDALGNIGVIASALIIWLTTFSWRFYFDPLISLFITLIILSSAIPLCMAAGRILLLRVPAHIDVDEIKEDIEKLPGILSCHHVHVWQISDVKMVASLHIRVLCDFKDEGSAKYMRLQRAVRRCLHEFGIHHSTIQPEFCMDEEHPVVSESPSDHEDGGNGESSSAQPTGSKKGSQAPSNRSQADACLMDCTDSCAAGQQCPMTGHN